MTKNRKKYLVIVFNTVYALTPRNFAKMKQLPEPNQNEQEIANLGVVVGTIDFAQVGDSDIDQAEWEKQ